VHDAALSPYQAISRRVCVVKTFSIREHDYYGGSLEVVLGDAEDEFDDKTITIRWKAYEAGSASIEVLYAKECDALAAAFTELAALQRARSAEIEEKGRLWRKEMGFPTA